MYSELAHLVRGFDRISTENYYRDQLTAKENCSCKTCAYFEDVFVERDFHLFSFLKNLGVDIRKGQDIDPEGLWMLLDEKKKFLRCTMDYVIKGNFDSNNPQNVAFQFVEENTVFITLQGLVIDQNTMLIQIDFKAIN